MKKRGLLIPILVITSVLFAVSLAGYFFLVQKILNYDRLIIIDSPAPVIPREELLQQCPNKWIDNQMPGETTRERQYFILDGKRRELKEFDLEWVRKNCKIKPEVVY